MCRKICNYNHIVHLLYKATTKNKTKLRIENGTRIRAKFISNILTSTYHIIIFKIFSGIVPLILVHSTYPQMMIEIVYLYEY